MLTTHVEVERSFAPPVDPSVPALADLPGLGDLKGVERVEPAGEADLDATYYDTPGLALLRAGVTFRRRSGGADAGWHLKLPVGQPGARRELHLPLKQDNDAPPAELVDLVGGWTAGIVLAGVARIRTRRTTTRLVGRKGAVLAELADDEVLGLPAQLGAQKTSWREWEVELVDGKARLLDDVEALCADAGVPRSTVQRKIEAVLGTTSSTSSTKKPGRTKAARRLVHARIAEQALAIETLDPDVRRDLPDSVHGLRQAARRLRAALATYGPLLDGGQIEPLREDLRWLARSLGGARDAEVALDRIEALLAEQPDAMVVGPVHERLALQRESHAALAARNRAEVFGSERYRGFRSALTRLVTDPQWTDLAEQKADKVLPSLVRAEWRRTDKARRRAVDPHDARKAAKRLRYAYESLEPTWGTDAKKARKAATGVTMVLGDLQDSAVARTELLALAAVAAAAGESAFTYGRLHLLEEQHADDLASGVRRAWKKLEKKRL